MTQLIKAKHMYFSGIPVIDIASELSLDLQELGYRIFGRDKTGTDPDCWHVEKGITPIESFVTYRHVKPYILSMAEQALTSKLASSASHISESADHLDLDQMHKATQIITAIDKIGRLEKGEATEHVKVDQGFTLRDIRNGVRILDDDEVDVEDSSGIPHLSE